MQTEKRKNRPSGVIEDSLDEAVNLEDLHRDDYAYDEEYFGYEEDYPLPEKRKNQPAVARYHDLSRRARRLVLFAVLSLTLVLISSSLFVIRTVETSGISPNVKELASGMGQTMARDLTSSMVPGIVSIIPLLVMLFGVVFILRVMRRHYRD